MQIAILVEQMRREGYEVMVSRPEVIFQRDEDGSLLEPIENLYVEVPNENLGDVLQSIAARKGEIARHGPSRHARFGRSDHSHARSDWVRKRSGQSDPRRRDHEPSLPRIRPLQRRDRKAAIAA